MFLGPKAIHPIETGNLPLSSPGMKEEYSMSNNNNNNNENRPY